MSLLYYTNEDFIKKMKELISEGTTPSSMCVERLSALGYTLCHGKKKRLHLRYLGRDLLFPKLRGWVRGRYQVDPEYFFPGVELPWETH